MSIEHQVSKFQLWLDDVDYKDWGFGVSKKGEAIFLVVTFLARDNDDPTSEWKLQRGRKWLLSQHMTKSEFIQTALKAVLTAEEHEIQERFTYKGQPIFGPHFNVDELHRIASNEDIDIRKEQSKNQNHVKD